MAFASCRGSSTSGRSKTRMPTRFEPTPSRIFRRGRSCWLKKASSAAASLSGSRTSPPTTIPSASRSRAALVSRGLPLLTTRAAASCDEPTFSPTICLCRVASGFRTPDDVEVARFQKLSEMSRFSIVFLLPFCVFVLPLSVIGQLPRG